MEKFRHSRSSKRRESCKEAKNEFSCENTLLESLGYTDAENPFGDSSLSTTFKWLKRSRGSRKLSAEELARLEKKRRLENLRDLEELKRKREQRELEAKLRERDQMFLQRERDQMTISDWKKSEKIFYFEQTKARALARIKSGRPKPIDLLLINIVESFEDRISEEFFESKIYPISCAPYTIFEGMNSEKIEELRGDIKTCLCIDKKNSQYWESLMVISEYELEKCKTSSAYNINSEVLFRIEKLLQSKTVDQLVSLNSQIQEKLSSGAIVDIEYWEMVTKYLIIWKAKLVLSNINSQMYAKNCEKIKPYLKSGPIKTFSLKSSEKFLAPKVVRVLSPVPFYQEEDFEEVVSIETFTESLEQKRSAILKENMAYFDANALERSNTRADSIVEQDFINEARRDMDLNNSPSIDSDIQPELVQLSSYFKDSKEVSKFANIYDSYDKYQPRKPKYFNQVHTGYEWNKYNQMHYDYDNPPPKVVQGYKFNIFYMDLIDKSTPPIYVKEKDSGYPNTIILRFKAGPPYEDIAFRIVNREWEYGHKKGFRSSFDRGILQLWFRFKRHYYRR